MESLGKSLAAVSRELRTESPKPSGSSPKPMRSRESSTDAKRRHLMLTKFFALYPAPGDTEAIAMRLLAYHDELADLHVEVLGRALRRLVRSKGEFLPSVYQIRRSAAYVIRAARGGRDPMAPEDREPLMVTDPERFIAVGPKPGEPCDFAQLAAGAVRLLR